MATSVNLEAEQQAIITILNSKEENKHLVGRLLGVLTAEDFGSEAGNEVMAKLSTRLRSGRELPKRNSLKMDSSFSDDAKEFLENIQSKPLRDDASIDHLIETLKFHRKIRKIFVAAREMAEACKRATVDDIKQIESKLDQLTLDIKGNENSAKIITFGQGDRSAADEVIKRILSKNDDKRIKTGFNYFDSRAGGFKKGHAVLMAGPSGGGKSALANQLLISMYMKTYYKTLFVSFEMDDEECVSRLCANVCGIDFAAVEQKKLQPADAVLLTKEIDRFHKIGEENEAWFKVWPPDEDLTASNVISYCRPLKPDVMVVDYVGLLGQDNPREEQWRALGSAMRQFKIAAKKLGCCIIVLAQFDQDDMVVKYARALREHANIMWCWQYGPEEEAKGYVTILQKAPYGKNRNCPPFNFRLRYELKLMRIHDFGAAEEEDEPKQMKGGGRGGGKKGAGGDVKKRVMVGRTMHTIFEE